MAKIVIQKQSAPATPDAGNAAIFVDSADNKIKIKWDDGNTNTIVTSNTLQDPSSFIITSDYPLGEQITDITKSCVFKETAPTFAQATQSQNIGDVAGNTRVSKPDIATGIAWNSVKLALAKVGSPTAFLRVRIETDNAGVPSGTLVDTNATKDIDPATLTTSLADTTVTFPWSFTVADGTKVHTVVSAVWDVVNASNYYKIGYSTNDTSTRWLRFWNWNLRYTSEQIAQSTWDSLQTYGTYSHDCWYRITMNRSWTIDSVTKHWSVGATKCIIKDSAWTILYTANFSGNVATFSWANVISWATYRVVCNNNWSNYVMYYSYNNSVNSTWVWFNYIWWIGVTWDVLTWWNITTITTTTDINITKFPYISSTLFHNAVLSLTDSDFAYKVDLYGIATAIGVVGSYPKLVVSGISNNFTGLTIDSSYYLTGTPWAISTSAWTNIFKIGIWNWPTKLNLVKTLDAFFAMSGTTVYLASKDWFVVADALNGITWYADFVNWTTVITSQSMNTYWSGSWQCSICFPVLKWQYFKTSAGWKYFPMG